MPVPLDAPGRLYASLLDARQTFDRLIQRYAPEEEASRRILENRFYQQLSERLRHPRVHGRRAPVRRLKPRAATDR